MFMKKTQIKGILLILIIVLFWSPVFSQTRAFTHYDVEDGLLSSEVYSAFQDSKGYMWFATDAGVSRYNGYEFESFNNNNGFSDLTTFLITEDHKGRIWFGTHNCQLSYFENDSIFPFKHNDKIASHIKTGSAMYSFQVDKNENVWIGFFNIGLYKIEKDGTINQMVETPQLNRANIFLTEVNNEIVFGRIVNVKDDTVKEYVTNVFNDKTGKIFEYSTLLDEKREKIWKFGFTNCNGYNISIAKNQVIIFNENNIHSVILPWLDDVTVVSIEAIDDNIWVSTHNNGVFNCVIENNQLILQDQYLANKPISRVYKDRENGYWFLSTTEGVYYLPSLHIKHQSLLSKPIRAIEIDTTSGVLYTLFRSGVLTKQSIIDDKESTDTLCSEKEGHYSNVIKYNYSNNELLGGCNNTHLDVDETIPRAILIDSNRVYSASSIGLVVVEEDTLGRFNIKRDKNNMWCTSLIKNKDNIWIGTNKGVKVFSNEKMLSPFENDEYLSSGITCMTSFNNNYFLIGTANYGMLVMSGDRIVDTLNSSKGLVSNLIRTLHVDNEGVIWGGTNKGLNRVDYHSQNNYKIQNFTTKHGLVSNEIIDIKSYHNTIYVATSKGLVNFDKTKVKLNLIPPQVNINSFLVNSTQRILNDNLSLNYKENFIQINYVGLNYKSLGEVAYQYRMLGVDTNWISTTSRFVQYPTLQPNDYIFEVRAKNEDNIWSKPTVISFTINPPYWLTWWFISLEIIMGLIVILFVIKYRENQLTEKNTAEKKMIELELKALRSQMNPHFIFNTLNSIQYYIAKEDFKNTNKYISKFSQLIRTVLHLSEKNIITIQEEVEMLALYFSIEKMRFDNQFDYEINVSTKIDSEYDEIPSMLIQPYIENAIWHGLMNKEEKGKITLTIKIESDFLYCIIKDNGIGRKKAEEIKAKRNINHKSIGMTITKERLDIINNNEELNVVVKDLYDLNGKSQGTEVTIKIPYYN